MGNKKKEKGCWCCDIEKWLGIMAGEDRAIVIRRLPKGVTNRYGIAVSAADGKAVVAGSGPSIHEAFECLINSATPHE